jgi:hypothetical protein
MMLMCSGAGAHVMFVGGGEVSVPIHVLIQSHVQPGETVFELSDHVANCFRAAGGGQIETGEAFGDGRSVKTAGVWQRLSSFERRPWIRDN